MSDWNAKTIAEFRANEGRVGGYFEGAPLVLLHHRGRKSGRAYVNPAMYLPTRPSRTSSTCSQQRVGHPPMRTGTTT
jgi:F420H(2)-dependent quinone reductase